MYKGFLYRDYNFVTAALAVGVTPPDMVQVNGGTIYLSGFHGATAVPIEQVFGAFELDHDWMEGTTLRPHVHWMPSTAGAGNVKWQLTYAFMVDGSPITAEQTVTVTEAAGGVAWVGRRADFDVISGAGYKIGTQFSFRFFRNPGDGDDTYGADAVVMTLGFHVQINSIGSRKVNEK